MLSPTQREDTTAESMQRIEEEHEGRKLAAHSIPLNAFYDARSTIQSVETQVGLPNHQFAFSKVPQLSQLHSRTGLEFLLMACRSTAVDFAKPFAYFSSDTIKGFFSSSLNQSIDDFALQLEAYVMSGIKGVAHLRHSQVLLRNHLILFSRRRRKFQVTGSRTQEKTATLIMEKLHECRAFLYLGF